MKLKFYSLAFLAFLLGLYSCYSNSSKDSTASNVDAEVIVIGDGTGAIAAALGSARAGVSTMLITEMPWLGGMLTSAGVSAIDGNHWMPAGIWGEFRDSLRNRYGGADSLATGWISFTLFEPQVGAQVFDHMAAKEENLTIIRQARWTSVSRINDNWKVSYLKENRTQELTGKIVVDGTDLGDVAAAAGVKFDVGMDSRNNTGESMAPIESNDIIQDLTYVAILKDYGPHDAPPINPSPGYSKDKFLCACQHLCDDSAVQTHPCSTMLTYAKLPNNKYMINWPNFGNDYYLNLIELDQDKRAIELQKAKAHTLDFIYFIQQELGYKNLGLDPGEFPTEDHLPLMPYHREGRRIHGKFNLTINHILQPFGSQVRGYKTGIAVGDYPVDHHHNQRPDAPEIEFPKIPSFNIPLGCLIPMDVDQIVVADKSISVTNIVNGASRLQPVILQVGQAAGIAAAIAVKNKISCSALNIRQVQQALLDQNGYLMPYYDVPPEHPHFTSIQKVGATGILKGKGEPYQWANRTWFYPDSLATAGELGAIDKIFPIRLEKNALDDAPVFLKDLQTIASQINKMIPPQSGESGLLENTPLTRAQLAYILDQVFQIFEKDQIDWEGRTR